IGVLGRYCGRRKRSPPTQGAAMRGTTTRVLVVATVVALAGALIPSATADASGPTSPPPQTYMRLPGVVPALSLGSGNLVNHGGHVESGVVTNYVIYWGMPSQSLPSPAYDIAPYAAHIDEFLHDVSCCGTPAIAGILPQYVGGVSITYGG